ncbi:MAG: phosphoglucosamine mutase, partial [Myxococcota bacterium]
NIGLERCIKAAGGNLVRTPVGDRYVVEEMRKNGYNLGGEQSGHLIFLDYMTTGDGLVAALRVLSAMRETGKPISELAQVMTRTPQVLVNVKVKNKVPLGELPEVQKLIAGIEKKLGDQGRVLVRYSGTESKARVMVEGPDEYTIRGYAEEIAAEMAARCA